MSGVSRGAPGWLTLAAAPVFAAVLTAAHGGSPANILCSAAHDASPFNGMTLMYALMSFFHAAPWMRLMSTDDEERPDMSPVRGLAR